MRLSPEIRANPLFSPLLQMYIRVSGREEVIAVPRVKGELAGIPITWIPVVEVVVRVSNVFERIVLRGLRDEEVALLCRFCFRKP